MRTKKITAFALAAVMAVGVLTAAPISAGASSHNHGNGYLLRDNNTQGTGMVVMGDSRIVQIFHCYGFKGAAFANWGSHYGYGGSLRIDTDRLFKDKNGKAGMKATVKNELKKTGKCKVIIEATVNDYDGSGNYTGPVKCQLDVAKKAYKWTAKYNGKVVHPTVYCTSLIASKKGSASRYNTHLKNKLKEKANKNINYLGITPDKKEYESDGLHYTKKMAKAVWDKMDKAKF